MEEKFKKIDSLRSTMMGFNSHWAQTSKEWHDHQKWYFQRKFIDTINSQINPTMTAWDKLVEVIKAAEDQLKEER